MLWSVWTEGDLAVAAAQRYRLSIVRYVVGAGERGRRAEDHERFARQTQLGGAWAQEAFSKISIASGSLREALTAG